MPRFALSFAHAVKRRFIQPTARRGDAENLGTVVLACAACHGEIEKWGRERMREIVMRTIEERTQ